MATQANQDVVAPPTASTLASMVGDFARINPLEFYGLRVDEGPQEFINEVYKVIEIIGVSSEKKA